MNRRYKTKRAPVTAASPVLREAFTLLDKDQIAYSPVEIKERWYRGRIARWRWGTRTPDIISLETFLQHFGYRLRVEKIDD